jgi:hypothetical protein
MTPRKTPLHQLVDRLVYELVVQIAASDRAYWERPRILRLSSGERFQVGRHSLRRIGDTPLPH